MLLSMRLFLDSFWRALAYCLMPRVIALSLVALFWRKRYLARTGS